jgi:serine O-acetyltransferase
MLKELRRDSARYSGLGGWYTHPGFWVGATYRLGVWAHSLPLPARLPLVTLYRIAKLPWRVLLNVKISPSVRIGPGLCLIHPNNILIPGGVEIGEDCLVFHDVTLGTGPTRGLPKIGNGVDLYVGSRVLGGVTVGDGCMVGANCVVTRDVPPGHAVLAPPSRILPRTLLACAKPAPAPDVPVPAAAAAASADGADPGEGAPAAKGPPASASRAGR